MWIKRRWLSCLTGLGVAWGMAQPSLRLAERALDWEGRREAATGGWAMLADIPMPPSWASIPIVIVGLLLIWWDGRRNRARSLARQAVAAPAVVFAEPMDDAMPLREAAILAFTLAQDSLTAKTMQRLQPDHDKLLRQFAYWVVCNTPVTGMRVPATDRRPIERAKAKGLAVGRDCASLGEIGARDRPVFTEIEASRDAVASKIKDWA